jgi:DNA-binding MarR family transcriptional regulator
MFAKVPDMTPARFDFLFLISKGTRFLVEIRKKLGLRRQTTWVMMERLVELKLLTKTIVVQKFAQKLVRLELTDEGRARIRLALNAAFNVTIVRPPVTPVLTRTQTMDAMYQEVVAIASQRRAAEQPPKISGREVGRLYSELARRRAGRGKGKMRRYLEQMEETIYAAREMAKLLGDTTRPIYHVDYRELANPELIITPTCGPRELARARKKQARLERTARELAYPLTTRRALRVG